MAVQQRILGKAGRILRGLRWRFSEKPAPKYPFQASPGKSRHKLLRQYRAGFWKYYGRLDKAKLQQRARELGIEFEHASAAIRANIDAGHNLMAKFNHEIAVETAERIGSHAGIAQRAKAAFLDPPQNGEINSNRELGQKMAMAEVALMAYMEKHNLNRNVIPERTLDQETKRRYQKLERDRKKFANELYLSTLKQAEKSFNAEKAKND